LYFLEEGHRKNEWAGKGGQEEESGDVGGEGEDVLKAEGEEQEQEQKPCSCLYSIKVILFNSHSRCRE
jgi:hypothetical protein